MNKKSFNFKSELDDINGFYEWNQPFFNIKEDDKRC